MVAASTTSSTKKTRPSDDRRKRLAEEIKLPTVSSFFPIERYYDAAEKVYEELRPISRLVQTQPEASWTLEDLKNIDPSQLVYDTTFNTGLDMSYLYAKRYCIFCVEAIPKHNYYNSAKYQPLKQKHALQMSKVLRVLERVVEQMDVQEQILILLQERREKEDQLLLVERHRLVQETSSKSVVSDSRPMSIQESALEKLKILMPPSTVPTPLEDTTLQPSRPSSTRFHLTDDDDKDAFNNQSETNESLIPDHAVSLDGMKPLLPPMVPIHHHDDSTIVPLTPPTPPSYEAVLSAMQNRNRPSSSATITNNNNNNKDTSYIRPPPEPVPPKPKKEKIRPPPPMRQQQEYYKAMYNQYQQMGKIQVSSIDTYQGRVSESTNGCTVISALIVARHLQDSKPFTMISNAAVQNVIDVQCGPILRTIRKKLGLGGHALIIPSDVHDHLVDDKILLQEQFTGAAGGNIMNQQHYYEFLQLLSDTTSSSSSNGSSSPAPKTTNGKAGATLFFREHVISIVKSIDPNTKQSYYDLIDSMPGMLHNGKSMATRTRCMDMESLEVLLLWYASRKFSDSNCSYIDRNPWDDNTADLDPRVFQGFVWSS